MPGPVIHSKEQAGMPESDRSGLAPVDAAGEPLAFVAHNRAQFALQSCPQVCWTTPWCSNRPTCHRHLACTTSMASLLAYKVIASFLQSRTVRPSTRRRRSQCGRTRLQACGCCALEHFLTQASHRGSPHSVPTTYMALACPCPPSNLRPDAPP